MQLHLVPNGVGAAMATAKGLAQGAMGTPKVPMAVGWPTWLRGLRAGFGASARTHHTIGRSHHGERFAGRAGGAKPGLKQP